MITSKACCLAVAIVVAMPVAAQPTLPDFPGIDLASIEMSTSDVSSCSGADRAMWRTFEQTGLMNLGALQPELSNPGNEQIAIDPGSDTNTEYLETPSSDSRVPVWLRETK